MRAKYVLLCALAASMAACSTKGGTKPTESHSGFDNARVVDIAPHGAMCEHTFGPCLGLGAQWSSARPQDAFLHVDIYDAEYRAIMSVELNIDGDIARLPDSPSGTSFESTSGLHESTRTFHVPYAVIRRMLSAKRVWVRANTTEGSVEGGVLDGARDSKAFNALKRFDAQVRGADA